MNPQLYNSKLIEKRIESKSIGEAVIATCPKVSVVIPAYNVSEFVVETLQSVFSQTFQDFEILLVNDGSPDTIELEETLAPFVERLIYVKQPNGGAASARNTAIFLARGELLAFLDGDDIWEPNYLELQAGKLEENKLDLIYADAMMFGLKPWDGKTFMQLAPSKGEVSFVKLLIGECNVITSGTIVKREKVLNSDGFDEDREISGFEDFDLWTRIAKNGCRIGYQKNILLKYRVVKGSLSGGLVERAERGVKNMLAVKQKIIMNAEEEKAWQKQLALAKAQVSLEMGKVSLTENRFIEAREFIEESNRHFKKIKLSVVITILKISPRFLRYLFKTFHVDEFSFANNSNKNNSV
jgi:glycosyltransferase involved in cell wall biosynthesis